MADTDDAPQEGAETSDDTAQESGSEQPEPSKSEVETATEKHLADLRKENASWRTKLRKAEVELGKLKETSASEIEKARAEARQEALAEATAEANKRIVRAEVIAAASGKLQDPTDALGQLDLDSFEVGDAGDIDRPALTQAIEELLKSKPYLGVTRDPEFGSRPSANGGSPNMNDLIKQRLTRR